VSADGCGAPAGGAPVSAATDAGTQAVVQGRVTQNGAAVPVGYARLLNAGGEFVAEVPLDRLRHAIPAFPTRNELWLRLLEKAGI